MTGAIVPDGCDVVFMVEESQDLQNGKIRFTGRYPKLIYPLELKMSEQVMLYLEKGKFIKPQDIAIMASVGHMAVLVKKRPSCWYNQHR